MDLREEKDLQGQTEELVQWEMLVHQVLQVLQAQYQLHHKPLPPILSRDVWIVTIHLQYRHHHHHAHLHVLRRHHRLPVLHHVHLLHRHVHLHHRHVHLRVRHHHRRHAHPLAHQCSQYAFPTATTNASVMQLQSSERAP